MVYDEYLHIYKRENVPFFKIPESSKVLRMKLPDILSSLDNMHNKALKKAKSMNGNTENDVQKTNT